MSEYKLSYTAEEIDEKLKNVVGRSGDTENPSLILGDERSSIIGEYGYSLVIGEDAHASGNSIAVGWEAEATGGYSLAVGVVPYAHGDASTALGAGTAAEGACAIATGSATQAMGVCSHAEGEGSIAEGDYSHAGGWESSASGKCANAWGYWCSAYGDYSHASGDEVVANHRAFAHGGQTQALGEHSVALGRYAIANGRCSSAQGDNVIAEGDNQSVWGRYNDPDLENKYIHIVGNGYENTDGGEEEIRFSNAHTLDWDGNAWFQGNVYVGGTNQIDGNKLLTEAEVRAIVAEAVATALANN